MPPAFRDRSCSGFTLTELLVSASLLALLLGMGVPSLAAVMDRSRSLAAMLQLKSMLELARQHAVVQTTAVTLCGTNEERACVAAWSNSAVLAFVDANANRAVDPGETILAESVLPRSGTLRWKASGARSYIRFDLDGGVREYGMFVYCPEGKDSHRARALIVAPTGRVRTATDRTLDGIPEDGSGRNIACV